MTDPLQRTDLNLLVSFRILFEERCVTRAAQRLCISQPAMSKTLQRLRLLFDDPLFVRVGRGVDPTPKAERLFSAIHPVLEQVRATVLDRAFDPALAEGRIRIVTSDTLATAILPPLFLALQREAPRVQLVFDAYTDNHLECLSSGKADFSLYLDREYGEEFEIFRLTDCPLVCWMRAGHPLEAEPSVAIGDMRRYPLIALTSPDRRYFPPRDEKVAQLQHFYHRYDLNEQASAHVTSLYVAAEILHRSDAVMLGPPLWGGGAAAGGLVFRPCREAGPLTVPLALIQHRRTLGSPLHTWVRGLMQNIWSDVSEQWLTLDLPNEQPAPTPEPRAA